MDTKRLAVLVMAMGIVLAACGTPEEEQPEAQTVEVTAVDYAFEGLPATLSAGSTLTLTNDSEAEAHELVAMRLPEDETRSVEEILALPEEELEAALPEGPPTMVLVARPGEDGSAVVGDGTVTETGRYLVACFIPLGADPDEFFEAAEGEDEGPPDVAGGLPHFTEGMHAELTVE